MPTTINGIGTHYYGKKNLQVRDGCCEACGAHTQLYSYDTGLYFVFIFIPVFPLGRKRVVDYCSRCHRHRVLPLDQWNELVAEAMRNEGSVGGAAGEMSPETPGRDLYDPFSTKPRPSLLDRLHSASGRWVLLGLLVLFALLGVTLYGWHEANHQPLIIVNGLDRPVHVSIDGGESEIVAAGSHLKTVVAEGEHQAIAKGEDGLNETIDFTVENSIAQRYFGDSAFVLNVAKAGTLLYQQITYSENPNPLAATPSRLYYGDDFFVFRDIDYAFCEARGEIRIDSGSDVTRSQLTMIQGEPWQALAYFQEGTPPQEILSYFEHVLAFHPNDEELLALYASLAETQNMSNRCRAYSEKGLQRRPVAVEWHRAYQGMEQRHGSSEPLIARYDAMLEASPNDSMLLYLRGRITPNAGEADAYFDKAIETDAKNSYAHLAKAYHLAAHGRFAEARPLIVRAYELNPRSASTSAMFFEIHLALRDFDALDRMLATPADGLSQMFGCKNRIRALVAKGDVAGARACHDQFVSRLGPAGASSTTALRSRHALEYLLGEMDQAAATAEQIQLQGENPGILWETRLEQGRPDQAEPLLESFPEGAATGTHALLMSLAWNADGKDASAKRWRETAIDLLSKGSVEERNAATLLKSGDAATIEKVDDLSGDRTELIVLLTALADASPPLRKDLVARAEKLNTLDTFPHRFLKRTLARMRQGE